MKGYVNSLYIKNKVGVKKVIGQNKCITHGCYFENAFKKAKMTNENSWRRFIQDKIFKIKRGEVSNLISALIAVLATIDMTHFLNYEDELIVILDALLDCIRTKETCFSTQQIKEIFKELKLVIELGNLVFPNGMLNKQAKTKITLVMAVIDDRHIDRLIKATEKVKDAKNAVTTTSERKSRKALEKAQKCLMDIQAHGRSREGALFKHQQLWGLDSTVKLIQRLGFSFNLAVINENVRFGWDAFGPIEVEAENLNTLRSDSLDEACEDAKSNSDKVCSENKKRPSKESLHKSNNSSIPPKRQKKS